MPYRKFSDLDPIVLHSDDLLELERVLRKDFVCDDCVYSIRAGAAGQDLSDRVFHNCSELLQAGLPARVDRLEIEISRTDADGVVEKSIHITLDRDMCDVCVFSDTDQQWVAAANRAVSMFFNGHRPWYTGIKKMLAPMFNISMVLSLLMALPAMIAGSSWLLVFPAAFVAYSLLMMIFGQKQLFFPYTRIALYPAVEERRRNYELLWTLGWGVTAILAVVSGSLFIRFS